MSDQSEAKILSALGSIVATLALLLEEKGILTCAEWADELARMGETEPMLEGSTLLISLAEGLRATYEGAKPPTVKPRLRLI